MWALELFLAVVFALSEASTRRLLWWLLKSTRGGPTRVRILRAILSRPLNANQLAKELEMDYTTVRHHLDVLVKNGVLESVGEKYGAIFYLSKWFAQDNKLLDEILDETGKR